MKKKIRDVIENLRWSIYEDEQGVDLRKFSPAGEDFGFYIRDKKNIIQEIIVYADNFAPDEHAEMWVENMHSVKGVPQSIRTLIQDADDIKDMLYELKEALEDIEEVK